MSVVTLTPATSKEFLAANDDNLVVVIFDADFSGQQEIVEKALNSLSADSELKGKIALGLADVEVNNDLATRFLVITVPAVVCLKKGHVVKKIDTLEPTKLVNAVQEQLKIFDLITTDESGEPIDPKKAFNHYLKKLTSRAPVMVFMKGSRKLPRCGFSKQLMELLTKYDINFQTFDILQDEEVRQGLKEYSDWPTYPQIYVKGEFIGGLDILKQMEEAGELESTLKV